MSPEDYASRIRDSMEAKKIFGKPAKMICFLSEEEYAPYLMTQVRKYGHERVMIAVMRACENGSLNLKRMNKALEELATKDIE